PVAITTKLNIYAWSNLGLVSQCIVGSVYDLNGTARADGNYSGGWAGLGLGLARTDTSNADATVFFNVTSGTFLNVIGETNTYLYRVTYLVLDEATRSEERRVGKESRSMGGIVVRNDENTEATIRV